MGGYYNEQLTNKKDTILDFFYLVSLGLEVPLRKEIRVRFDFEPQCALEGLFIIGDNI
jgi:hypothetical protein